MTEKIVTAEVVCAVPTAYDGAPEAVEWCLHPYIAHEMWYEHADGDPSDEFAQRRQCWRCTDESKSQPQVHPFGGKSGDQLAVQCPDCWCLVCWMGASEAPDADPRERFHTYGRSCSLGHLTDKVCITCAGIGYVEASCCEHSEEQHYYEGSNLPDVHGGPMMPHCCICETMHDYKPGGTPLVKVSR